MEAHTSPHHNTHHNRSSCNRTAFTPDPNTLKQKPHFPHNHNTQYKYTDPHSNPYTTTPFAGNRTTYRHPNRPHYHHTKHTENRTTQPLKHRHHCPHIHPQSRYPLPHINPFNQRLRRPLRHSNQQRIQFTLPPNKLSPRKHRQHTRSTHPYNHNTNRGWMHDCIQKGQTMVPLPPPLHTTSKHPPPNSLRPRRNASFWEEMPTTILLLPA